MKKIRFLDLGTVSPIRSQTCYHAAAEVLTEGSPDTLILVRPASPYVCIGFHQDLDLEVDRVYCQSRGWPVFRREVGGGAVYLDAGQVFIQWVFQPSTLPAAVEEKFRLYFEPLVRTYQPWGSQPNSGRSTTSMSPEERSAGPERPLSAGPRSSSEA